jgi:chitinase
VKENYIGKNGYVSYFDNVAKSPYLYSPQKKVFVTYDDPKSIGIKTRYARDNGLGGIMFWELS